MVEEERRTGVHRGDPCHLLIGQAEVEYVEVLSHTLDPYRFRDGDDAALREPPQDDLAHGSAVSVADLAEHRIGEQVVPTLGEAALCRPLQLRRWSSR